MPPNIRQKLDDILRPVVTGLGFKLVGIKYFPQGKHSLLRVYIDKTDGITIDDCSLVSHQLSGILDVEEPISSQYQLEVSSPGMDRPLFSLDDFIEFTGHQVAVKLNAPVVNSRKISGIIDSVNEQTIKLKTDNDILELDFANIDSANLIPQF